MKLESVEVIKSFKTQGYVTIEQEEAPLFYECAECPQYKVDCFPEIMKWEDEK